MPTQGAQTKLAVQGVAGCVRDCVLCLTVLDKKVINREIWHVFVGEEKWWLQVWGKELLKKAQELGQMLLC